jgi:hypothetical protein
VGAFPKRIKNRFLKIKESKTSKCFYCESLTDSILIPTFRTIFKSCVNCAFLEGKVKRLRQTTQIKKISDFQQNLCGKNPPNSSLGVIQ